MTADTHLPGLDNPALERLTEFMREQYPQLEDLALSAIGEFGEGWETDLYRLSLTGIRDGSPADRELVLRLYKGADPFQKAQKEYSLLTGVTRFGIAAPRVDALVRDETVLGHPFLVMEFVAGGTLDQRIKGNAISQWLDPMARTLAQIHDLPWEELIPDPGSLLPQPGAPLAFVESHLQQMDAAVDRYGLADFTRTMSWLLERAELGATTTPALIHNDFHPQNILVRDEEMVIIDWSFAEVSDYRMDLAWSAMLTGAIAGQEHRPALLEAYEKATGLAIENIEYFEVLKLTLRMLTIATWLDDSVEIPVAGISKQAIRGGYKEHVLNPYRRLKEITGLEIQTIEEL